MALDYILRKVCQKTGLNREEEAERDIAIDFINEAAQELWNQTDLPGSLMEQVFPVEAGVQIALPSYVYSLRGMREYNSKDNWSPVDMRPRYQSVKWTDEWKKWRQKGYKPIQTDIETAGPLILTVYQLENTAPTLTFVGETTDTKNRVVTTAVNAAGGWVENAEGIYEKTLTAEFLDVTSIQKDIINEYDITVYDSDGNVLSVIPNNQLEVQYLIVDVSSYPWGGDCPDDYDKRLMEVLYKTRLPRLENDSDAFIIPDFDDIIVQKTLQLYYEEQPGNEERALLFDKKAERSSVRKMQDFEGALEKKIDFVEHPHDRMFDRVRYRLPRRVIL